MICIKIYLCIFTFVTCLCFISNYNFSFFKIYIRLLKIGFYIFFYITLINLLIIIWFFWWLYFSDIWFVSLIFIWWFWGLRLWDIYFIIIILIIFIIINIFFFRLRKIEFDIFFYITLINLLIIWWFWVLWF